MRISVRIDDAHARAAMIKAPSVMRQFVGDALSSGALEVSRLARNYAPKAFSTLTSSILVKRIEELLFRVQPGVNYARPVEEGRNPGKMPGAGLLDWVRQKTGLTGKDLDRTTFVIARAIGKHGIRPQPYMQPSMAEGESRVIALVREAAARGAREVMR